MNKLLSFSFALCLALAVVACGGSDSDSDDSGAGGSGGSAGSGGAGGTGGTGGTGGGQAACTKMCSDPEANCPYASVDCVVACNNMQAICSSGCTSCDGVDTNNCMAGCLGSASLMEASNVAYGCYAENNTCEGVGTCYVSHCPAQ